MYGGTASAGVLQMRGAVLLARFVRCTSFDGWMNEWDELTTPGAR